MSNPARYLVVVHDEVWADLVMHYGARGVDIMPIPPDEDDDPEDGTYYFLCPRPCAECRHPLAEHKLDCSRRGVAS